MLRAVGLVAAGTLLLAQEPIRVNTRLVEVNVVVRNGHGAVGGLNKSDFKVFDKGKERPIALFTAVTSDRAGAGAPAQKSATPEPLPPGVFTNRPETPDANPISTAVLLVDVLNTELRDQQGARKQMLKYIASMDPSASPRRVAIYVLTAGIRVLQDFTDDPAVLKRAVTKYQGEGSALLRGATEQTPYSDDADMATDATIAGMRESFNEMHDFHQVDRAQTTAKALEQIATHLARVPGRKTLIWLSGSFPFYLINDERHSSLASNREERTFNDEINQAVKALSAANIAIYPVDARGLIGMPAWDPANPPDPIEVPKQGKTSRYEAFGKAGNGQLGTMSVDMPDGIETMKDLADGTGGRAFYNNNDLQSAIGKAMEDAQVSYMIGFYASDPPDEAFHEIKVKVDRPGVEARYRSGYFSTAAKAPGEMDRMAIMRDATASALDATEIGLLASIARVEEPAGALHVLLKMDLGDFALENRNGRWTGAADINFVGQAADGTAVALASKTITFDLTNEVYLARKRDGVFLEQTMAANPKVNRVKVVVLDHQSGAVGSVLLRP